MFETVHIFRNIALLQEGGGRRGAGGCFRDYAA